MTVVGLVLGVRVSTGTLFPGIAVCAGCAASFPLELCIFRGNRTLRAIRNFALLELGVDLLAFHFVSTGQAGGTGKGAMTLYQFLRQDPGL